jgi:hypothetical protein
VTSSKEESESSESPFQVPTEVAVGDVPGSPPPLLSGENSAMMSSSDGADLEESDSEEGLASLTSFTFFLNFIWRLPPLFFPNCFDIFFIFEKEKRGLVNYI